MRGMGKTNYMIASMKQFMLNNPDEKVLFRGPNADVLYDQLRLYVWLYGAEAVWRTVEIHSREIEMSVRCVIREHEELESLFRPVFEKTAEDRSRR